MESSSGQRTVAKMSLHVTLLLMAVLLATPALSAVPASSWKSRSTCQSLECVKLAADMASMMNPAEDPCQDFYNYACGNFPNIVSFSPRKVTGSEIVGDFLLEGTRYLMQERVEKKSFELLLQNSNVTDSDPSVQDLYRLTRQFFHSCAEWVRKSDTDKHHAYGDDGELLSASFFRAMFREFVRLETGHTNSQHQLESILAALVRSGGGSLLSVKLPKGFSHDVLVNGFNLRNVIRADLMLFDRRWHDFNAEKFVNYFASNGITSGLSLDNIRARFKQVTAGLEEDAYGRESRAKQCGMTLGSTTYTVAHLDRFSKCMNKQNPFSWKVFFEKLLRSPVDTNEEILVKGAPALISVTNFYKRQPVYSATDATRFGSHVSYLIFDWLLSFGYFLPGALRQTWRRHAMSPYVDDSAVLIRSELGRVMTCQSWTTEYMQPVFERMYRVAYHPRGFNKVQRLIEIVKKASIKSARSQDWIEDETKQAIVDKINDMTHSIAVLGNLPFLRSFL